MLRPTARPLALFAALLVVGCGSTPTPSTSPLATGPLLLQATAVQAIPPLDRFGWLPVVTITADGIVVTSAPVPAIFPGPLVPPLSGRRISREGLVAIGSMARELGLLSGQTDFTAEAKPGQALGRITLTIDGQTVELTGVPNQLSCDVRQCQVRPGSPEAFDLFWQRLTDMSWWLGAEVGPEAPWQPEAYALLVGPAPDPQGLPQAPADWPLDSPLATLGAPVSDTQRCATVRGDEAALLRPALLAANQLTAWTQDPSTSATFGLTVRPLLPGEDVCRELFGIGN